MIRNTTKRQKLGWVLFILYLCLLAYFMFFSESFGRTDTDRGYAYNLVPFKEILRFIRYRGTVGLWAFLINIVGNVVRLCPAVSFFRLSAAGASGGTEPSCLALHLVLCWRQSN